MAFCPNCGNGIPEGSTDKFCSSCGHPLQENVNPETTEKKENEINTEEIKEAAKNVSVDEIITQAKSGNKKVIGIAIGAVAAVIVLFILIGSLFGGNYMDPVNAYMKAINDRETDYTIVTTALLGDKVSEKSQKVTGLFIDAEAELWEDYTYEDVIKDSSEEYEDCYDNIDDEFESWSISFEEKNAEKLDKDDLEDMAEDFDDDFSDAYDDLQDQLEDEDDIEEFADSYNIDEDEAKKIMQAQLEFLEMFVDCKVQDGYEVKGKFIIEADGDTYETDTIKFTVIKVNGSWIYMGSDDYISFEDDDDYLFYKLTNSLNTSGVGTMGY